MKDEIIYMIISVFAVAFASFASYSAGSERWQRLALGAILLSALAAPAAQLISEFDPQKLLQTSYPEVGESSSEAVAGEALCRGIAELVSSEFSLPRENIEVRLYGFQLSTLTAERIYITLSGRAALGDIIRIEEYIENEGFGECEVSISFE